MVQDRKTGQWYDPEVEFQKMIKPPTAKEYFEVWAAIHELDTISFWWRGGECRLHNRTYNEALAIAQEQGYREPKWYKPWTWPNGVVTVG